MKLEVTQRGKTATVELDLSLKLKTLSEHERFESLIDPANPVGEYRTVRVLIWAKLADTPFRDLGIDDFDLDVSELAAFADTPEEVAWVADGDSVVIPMETATGTVDAEVSLG